MKKFLLLFLTFSLGVFLFHLGGVIQAFADEPKAIYISKLNLYLPIQTSPIIDGQWQINEDKTAFFGEHSSLPGQMGTTIVFAHAKNGLFANLALLRTNDTITLVNKTSVFVYTITNHELLYPDDISFIKTQKKNILAIFTCFGKNDTKRIVYFGELVKIAPFPKTNPIVYKL